MNVQFPLLLLLFISSKVLCGELETEENDADRLDTFKLSVLYKYSIPLANLKSYIENNSINGGEIRLATIDSSDLDFGVSFSWSSFSKKYTTESLQIEDMILNGNIFESIFTQQVLFTSRYYLKLQKLYNIKLFWPRTWSCSCR